MERRTEYLKILTQFIRFGLVGILNNLITLAVYYFVIAINRNYYLFGNMLGFLAGTLNAYILNSRVVFRRKGKQRPNRTALGRTYVTYTVSLLISTGLLFLLINVFSFSEKIAPLFALIVTVPFNFFMNRLWVYRKGLDET